MPWIDNPGEWLVAEAAELTLGQAAGAITGSVLTGVAGATLARRLYEGAFRPQQEPSRIDVGNQQNASMGRPQKRQRTRSYNYSKSSRPPPSSSAAPYRRQRGVNYRIGGFLGKEVKYVDHLYDAATSTTIQGSEADPATALALNATAQGDGENSRDGRHAQFSSLHIRGVLTWAANANATTPEVPGFVRLMVVLDTQTNGAQFSAEDVLEDTGDDDLDAVSLRNLQNTQRFKVLKDIYLRRPTLVGSFDGTSTDYAACNQPFAIDLSKLSIKTTYSGSTAVIGAIADNSVHVIAIRNGTNACTLRYTSRMRFIS